ncbi:LysR family transcriptional regulator [Vibrio sp. FNV 38]|nr:LysR family transcriptional regulator [Vibrio sp. FNV 38]
MKHSDYSLIPTFVAIVEEKSYTKAAKKLGISQSAVSQGVYRLRDVFKDPLFNRNSRGVEPTQFALDIYPTLASAVENIAYTMPEHTKFIPAQCDKQFVISSLSVFGFTILPELSALMEQEAPQASVRIEPLYTHDVSSLLRSQQGDLVIEAYSNQYPQLRSQVIMSDTLCVVCRKDHPRLARHSISREEYLHEKHVTHARLDQNAGYLAGRGLKENAMLEQRRIAWQASSILEVLPIVEQTDYIGLLPQKLIDRYIHQYQVKHLQTDFLLDSVEVGMYWHSSRTNDPSHRWLRELVTRSVTLYQSKQ